MCCTRGPKPEEIDPVWKRRERRQLEICLHHMGFELARSIKRGRTATVAVVVRKHMGRELGKYPRGLGAGLNNYILTFGPEAVQDMRTAVILELNRWGLLSR